MNMFALQSFYAISKLINKHSLGIDIGTSGVRICMVNAHHKIVTEGKLEWQQGTLNNDDPSNWIEAVNFLTNCIPVNLKSLVSSICILYFAL